MTTTATGDASTIRQLAQAVRDHKGDFKAWARAGQQLAVQRTMLSPLYDNRTLFAYERVLPAGKPIRGPGFTKEAAAKLAYDLERGIDGPDGPRRGFSVNSLRIAAEAYGVALVSFAAALDGGELIPVAAPALILAAAPDPEPAGAPPPAVLMSGVLSPAAIAAAAPYATEILVRLRDLAVAGIMRPSGPQLFPDTPEEAAIWDRNANDMPDDELAWLIAGRRALETSARRDRTVVLTPLRPAG